MIPGNNDGITSPKNVEIEDAYRYIEYSEDENEAPNKRSKNSIVTWMKTHFNGNHYFLSKEDSKLL